MGTASAGRLLPWTVEVDITERSGSIPQMGPKTTKVYETIRGWLASGELAPGDKVPSERTLVEQLGIGRTALRQALTRLVSEGALEVRGRSSYRVPGGVSVDTPAEQEWQATTVATGVPLPSDDQFEALSKRFKGGIVHEADRNRLTMVWRIKAPNIWQATETASVKADSAMELDLGNGAQIRQLHVIAAEDVEV